MTALLGACATLFFSLLPALQASRRGGLRYAAAGRTHGRQSGAAVAGLGRRLAAGQVALTLALIVASALILGAVDGAVNGVLGFDKQHVMTARLTLPDRPYAEQERRRQFVARVLDRLHGIPAVESLGSVSFLPYAGLEFEPSDLPRGRAVDARRGPPGRLSASHARLLRDHAHSRCSTAAASPTPIGTMAARSRWSAAALPTATGPACRRSGGDSGPPRMRRGSRWWACPATSCTTGS